MTLALAGVEASAANSVAAAPPSAGASRVPFVDACLEIDLAFCKNGGAEGQISDLPAATSGFIIYNGGGPGGSSMLNLRVSSSFPNTRHSVFHCPGIIQGGVYGGGFLGCTLIGTFVTDSDGDGNFHLRLASEVTEPVIAINVPGFATVLANHPSDPI